VKLETQILRFAQDDKFLVNMNFIEYLSFRPEEELPFY